MSDGGEQAWRALAEHAIGAAVETLDSRTAEGLRIAPLYARHPGDPSQPWRADAAWSVAQRVDHPDPASANGLALLDLEGGADALVLVGAASLYARGYGLNPDDFDLTLKSIELDFIRLRLDAGIGTMDALGAFSTLAVRRVLTSAALDVDIGFDPIGWRARLGRPVEDEPGRLLELKAKAGLAGTAFLADGRPWHEAGAGEAQELAAIIATAVAYLRLQEKLGISLDAARDNVAVLLAVDADVLLGLAKLRAMRRLWARIETACGLDPKPLRLHAETSWRMMARRDPWTNVMRTTAATFAAGLGGADVVTVLPFTLPLGLPDAGARRLARNVQRVLLDEANLGKVADPAAGAGAFEAMTEGLCANAWALFKEIEREGGMARAVETGMLGSRIAETARIRAADIAHLTRGIVGTSRFASLDAPGEATLDIVPHAASEPAPDALPAQRDAAPFEALRDRADVSAADGRAPHVFLATLGPPSAFGARATYATNFFAAAGIAAAAPTDERGVEALTTAFRASGAIVACLCGPDAICTSAITTALRAAGARSILVVTDRPSSTGIDADATIGEGCDALHILEEVLGIIAAPA